MICYQDTNIPIVCPYCDKDGSCSHLIAMYDRTFDSIDDGVFLENEEFDSILSNFFIELIKENGFDISPKLIESHPLRELWEDIVSSKEDYLYEGEFDETAFYMPPYYNYLFEKLDEVVIPEYGEFEGGPGQSSLYSIYYSDKVQDDIDQLKKVINADILSIKKKLMI